LCLRPLLFCSALLLTPSHPFRPFYLFFFTDTATPEIYTLSLHDALPIYEAVVGVGHEQRFGPGVFENLGFRVGHLPAGAKMADRSEEHTSELQSRENLVCRLLLEKKKTHIPDHSRRVA